MGAADDQIEVVEEMRNARKGTAWRVVINGWITRPVFPTKPEAEDYAAAIRAGRVEAEFSVRPRPPEPGG